LRHFLPHQMRPDRSVAWGSYLEREESRDQSCQPGAHAHRVFCFIDDLINLPGKKPRPMNGNDGSATSCLPREWPKAPLAARMFAAGPPGPLRVPGKDGFFALAGIVETGNFFSTGPRQDMS